jgi:hypothetical protein
VGSGCLFGFAVHTKHHDLAKGQLVRSMIILEDIRFIILDDALLNLDDGQVTEINSA